MTCAVTVSSRIRSAYPVAAVAVLALTLGACASARFDRDDVTGATSPTGVQAVNGQPMPPALVGNNPIVQGQPNTAGQTNQVTTTALPPTTGGPTTTVPPTTVAATTTTTTPTTAAPGTTITVQPGETLYSLSRTHGVSVAAIAAANGLTQTSTLNIGQRLVIPGEGTTAGLGEAPLGVITETQTTPANTTAGQPVTNTGSHVVQTGETLYSISMRYGISVNSLAAANGMTAGDIVRVGQQLVVPGTTTNQNVAAAPQPTAPTQTTPQPTPAVGTPVAPPAEEVALTNPPAPTAPDVAAEPSVTGTDFRWPAQGRIISDFGPKPNGERNDGINLALPVGTDIHASESGVVIYAGNEIAGYGNLILVEHADNWVTAYAHLSEMLVSRGASVQRGQVIGLAGNSGAVTAAQLHFELRQGTVPVNPLNHLAN